MPISFCSYNFVRDLCGDWSGPGFCLCFCMQGRLQVSRKLHVLRAAFPGEDGTRQVWQACAQGNHFLWNAVILQSIFLKETSEACIERAEGDANKKKKIFKFPIVLHTTGSALQFSEMCCIYIWLYSVFLCICFSVRLSIVQLSMYHFIRHCSPQHYSKMGQRPEKDIKCFSCLP